MQLRRRMRRLRAGSKRGLSRAAFVAGAAALAGGGLLALLLGNPDLIGTPAKFAAAVPPDASKAMDKPMPPKTAAEKQRDFIADLRAEALAKAVPAAIFDAAFAGIVPDDEIMALSARQPEHDRSPWDYVGALVSQKRIDDGRAMLGAHSATLSLIEARYGVDKHIVLAIWGIESSYGSSQGGRNVIRSLATLAAQDSRRAGFWKGQLIGALQIVANGDIAARDMGGSWAGAMGHTQFMPTTYLAHAVDFDGDGRRDIWGSIPDALASTANYLKASKWVTSLNWGMEVVLPEAFDFALSAPGNARPLADWRRAGVAAPPGRKLAPSPAPLQLLLPAGATGPAFLVTSNFRAILRYNNSALYALAAGHLAERIAGAGSFTGKWPLEQKVLARDDRTELQQLLVGLGLDTGGIDGILGGRSRAAIRAFQKGKGLPADGFATQDLLAHLRRSAGLNDGAGTKVK